jgi:thiamine biosynthesis lipoprotein
VATSGDTQRWLLVDGRRLSHIVDPRTGQPVEGVPSATIIASDATSADALATAVSVLGSEEGLRLIESLEEVECLIMARSASRDLVLYESSGFFQYLD